MSIPKLSVGRIVSFVVLLGISFFLLKFVPAEWKAKLGIPQA